MKKSVVLILCFFLLLTGCTKKTTASNEPPADKPEIAAVTEGRDIPASWKKGEAAPIERVAFSTSDGIEIIGSYRPAAGASTEKTPGIICIPMLGRTRDDYDHFTSLLSEIGIASLAIDLRGHGESVMGGKIRFRSFDDKQWNECVKDVNAAIGFLSSRPNIDNRYLGLVGASIGANFAMLAGARVEVKMIVALSPGLDYHGVKIEQIAPNLKDKPIYIFASSQDQYSRDTASKLTQIMPSQTTVKIIEDRKEHGTEMFKIPFFLEDLIRWIKDNFDEMDRKNRTAEDLSKDNGKPIEVPY